MAVYTAGTLAVNLLANSAQFVAQMGKAGKSALHNSALISKAGKAIVTTFKVTGTVVKHLAAGIIDDFKSIGNAAKDMARALITPSNYLKGLAAGAAAIGLYTVAIAHQRLEMQRMGDQYGLTVKEASAYHMLATRMGVEAEQMMDARLQLIVKLQDKIEAGSAGSKDRMKSFLKDTYSSLNDATKQGAFDMVYSMHDAFNKATKEQGAALAADLADDMSDAGKLWQSIAKLSKDEINKIFAQGVAIAVDMSPVQEATGKFMNLKNIIDSTIMGILSKFAPLFSMMCDDWTKKLIDTFTGNGKDSLDHGFNQYVKDQANAIFQFVKETVTGMAKFLDDLNFMMDTMKVAMNKSVIMSNALGMFGVDRLTIGTGNLNKDDKATVDQYHTTNKELTKANAQKDYLDANRNAIVNDYKKSGMDNLSAWDKFYGEQKAAAEHANKLSESLDKLGKQVDIIEAKQIAKGDYHSNEKAVDGVFEKAGKVLNESLNKPLASGGANNKPNGKKNFAKDVGDEADADAAKKVSDANSKAWDAYLEKKKDFDKKLQELNKKFSFDERSEWQRKTADEKQELEDAFHDMQQIRVDYFTDALKNAKVGSAEYLKIREDMLKAEKALQLSHDIAMEELQKQQEMRRLESANRTMKEINDKHAEVMRGLGKDGARSIQGGAVGANNKQLDEHERMKNEWDKRIEDERQRGELSNDQMKQLEAQREEELNAHLERMKALRDAYGDTVVDEAFRIGTAVLDGDMESYGERESVLKGYSNNDLERAGQDRDAQLKMSKELGGQLMEQAATRSKKAFELNKKMKIAEAVMNTFAAVNATMAVWPFPMNMVFGGMALAQGLMNVAMIKQQKWQGQAHDGIDYVPNEGTWNLAKGERVMGSALNKDMTDFLAANKDGNFSSGPSVQVHVSNVTQGNVIANDEYEADLLSRNIDAITRGVQSALNDRGIRLA